MAVKVKFSSRYKAVQRRIRGLPKLVEGMLFATTKKDALNTIRNFRNGIRDNSFGLVELKTGTIRNKERLGMERPETPLYGRGEEERKNSYVNMLRFRKIKNGYRVFPSVAKHYSRRISLRLLYFVHEFGTLISGSNGAIIRIPPRPAFLEAIEKTLRERSLKENTQRVKRAITSYIKDGRRSHLIKEEQNFLRGLAKIEAISGQS